MKVRARVLVSGRVQGVFFRSSTMSQARIGHVTGWIRNLSDGRVETVMEGEKDSVEKLIDYVREGPPGSGVEDVEVTWEKPTHKYSEFEIRVQ